MTVERGDLGERAKRLRERREKYGRIVREAWVAWAMKQPFPKPTWLLPWEDLDESDREADRCIADALLTECDDLLAENKRLRGEQ